jgi:hypothetical protein
VEWWQVALVVLAGTWAGVINAVAGSGTLVTFPVLLAVGFAPVAATMTNAVGLSVGGLSGVWGYRRELAGQGRRLALLLPASLLGALGGAWLLLHLPEAAFETVVPVLVVLALVLVVLQPRLQRRLRARTGARGGAAAPSWPTRRAAALAVLGAGAVGVYGGYFAAAQGIMLLAVVGALVVEDLQRLNGLKNVLATGVNLVAAASYAVVGGGRVEWPVAGVLAASSLAGGWLGARYGRRLPAAVLRAVIVVVGLAAVVVLVVRP